MSDVVKRLTHRGIVLELTAAFLAQPDAADRLERWVNELEAGHPDARDLKVHIDENGGVSIAPRAALEAKLQHLAERNEGAG